MRQRGALPAGLPIMAGAALAVMCPGVVSAQVSSEVVEQIFSPDDFDRGRNVGVLEQPRPDYDETGIQIGSLIYRPSVEVHSGVTDNALLANSGERRSGFVTVNPALTVDSDWDRDRVVIKANGEFDRYTAVPLRNENIYDLSALGVKQVTEELALTGFSDFSRQFEQPYTGAVNSSTAVLSHFQEILAGLKGEYTAGRGRVTASYDFTGLNFAPLEVSDSSQSYRDRQIHHGILQFEYALTPVFAWFAQASVDDTVYQHDLSPGVANLNSTGERILAGADFDIPGKIRGKIGLGYLWRAYKSGLYEPVSGLSAEAQLEFFPNDLTTFHLTGARILQDSSIYSTTSFFDNRVALGVDRELRRDIIATVQAEYHRQTYVASIDRANYYGVSGQVRYLISHKLWLFAETSYSKRDVNAGGVGYNELRGNFGIRIQS